MDREKLLRHTPVESMPEFLQLREKYEDEEEDHPAS